MKNTKEIKLMIIENYVDYLTSDDNEREELKGIAHDYVNGDHVDEIAQANTKNDKRIVQLTGQEFGDHIGLYLVPKNISDDEFEKCFEAAEDQDDFDENNTLGIERVFADEIFVKE